MPISSVQPRRVPPPPPSRTKSVPAGQDTARHDTTDGTEVEESSPPLTSLQARMAALQLNQVGRSPSSISTSTYEVISSSATTTSSAKTEPETGGCSAYRRSTTWLKKSNSIRSSSTTFGEKTTSNTSSSRT